jgi:hypothetical protein
MDERVKRSEELIIEDRGREGDLLEEATKLMDDVDRLRDDLTMSVCLSTGIVIY